ncbi:16S rRNA (cytosine(1402)-N(4))-methyltransferase RsmH [Fulvimarina sp. 2208YS6-2-32]|uniref:Ribosomal RNA small subunit methyltransferase H n=1 Tax=Fulvimarina uroteuthidis TaxID=3098149 RepID=A0ABU5I5V8_9HYPH|nr:16S rRNA (cytosine(1402)-N(4))-methyltransferase RsmH [Fulvimarina sp. 2208YS6-2-32]MDY8110752.1 16S rRNA (cytosine(1402)-N(4))-methyltransferase RsmH [Fulvimarina sp. 2208YS6-2-32]
MTGHGGHEGPTIGGPTRHVPVLLAEVIAALDPAPGAQVVDATFGAGGYSRAILSAGAAVIAIDRDPGAIETAHALAAQSAGRLRPVPGRFGDMETLLADHAGDLDGIVLDIGVSSMQIDEAERGFSFQKDGPLDMRMGNHGPTAADVVNTLSVGDLARIFNFLGDERHAGRAARAIAARREAEPFTRTLDLAGVVGRAVGRGKNDKIDPATRCFQALRIFVNDELGELARALTAAERLLKPGGRLVVVSFHSLEDRIVKRFFLDRAGTQGGSRHLPDVAVAEPTFLARNKAITASEAEASANPRARSAKLRSGTRLAAPPRGSAADLSFASLPTLAELSRI